MAIRTELIPGSGLGYAELVVKRWQVQPAAVEFSVQRNQDGNYFKGSGIWISEVVWHNIASFRFEAETKALICDFGPDLVDSILLASSNNSLRVSIRTAEREDSGGLVIDDGVFPSTATGSNRSGVAGTTFDGTVPPVPVVEAVPQESIEPKVEAVEEAPDLVQEEEPVQAVEAPVVVPPVVEKAEKKSKKLIWLLLAILLLLILIGAGVWFFLKQLSGPTLAEPKQPVTAPVAQESDKKECDLSAIKDEYNFAQTCWETNPTTDKLKTLLNSADQKSCGAVLRLMSYAGRSNEVDMIMLLAQVYDPNVKDYAQCDVKDAGTAVHWYNKILEIEPSNQEAAKLKKSVIDSNELPEYLKE